MSISKDNHVHSQDSPLYSKKLHILVRLASTNCVTSLTIFAFVLFGSVWNHLASLTFPVGQYQSILACQVCDLGRRLVITARNAWQARHVDAYLVGKPALYS